MGWNGGWTNGVEIQVVARSNIAVPPTVEKEMGMFDICHRGEWMRWC